MAGQGHQFPGNFQGNAGAMRNGFGGGPMQMGAQGMASQGMGGQGMAGQGMGGQGMAGQGMAGQGMAGQGMTSQGMTGQGMTGQGMVGPGMAGQGMASQAMGAQGMAPGMGGQGMGAQAMGAQGMGGQGMPSQLAGVMGGPMGSSGMVGMGSAMVPPYAAAMQNQMGTMAMGGQSMAVGGGVSGVPGQGMGSQPVPQPGPLQPAVAAPPPAAPAAPQPPQNKEFNTASLCKFGQETVQDIVSRTQEVFQTLKAIQPPNGTPHGENASNDKKAKMQEQLRTIRLLFKRLRLIYEKCNETCQGMEYTHMESLIPLKDEADNKALDERRNTESYRLTQEENKELTEQVVLKNKQLKEVITNLRTIIWEINVMLTMRRS